ncbi:hypothetical protein OEA41_004196 [Lepraria neglecta]|uniref:Uncharacterized protein n=1 Tax=Lepraria neglecta TaxID=209136 RepID=A0AAD9Z5Z3_9LECA|nr:hypothetical protein OEA41_004196 [Lepraria neglecta]
MAKIPPPSKAGNLTEQPARIVSVVSEWIEGFFKPKGVRIRLHFTDDLTRADTHVCKRCAAMSRGDTITGCATQQGVERVIDWVDSEEKRIIAWIKSEMEKADGVAKTYDEIERDIVLERVNTETKNVFNRLERERKSTLERIEKEK